MLLAKGRWFFPGTPASSTIKTCRHDIAEILLKVALKHQKNQSIFASLLSFTTEYFFRLSFKTIDRINYWIP